MSRLGAVVAVAILVSCVHHEAARETDETPPHADPGREVETLLLLEKERARAISEGDAFALGQLLDDGFVSVDVEGTRRNGPQVVEKLRAAATEAARHLKLHLEDLAVHAETQHAVVTGREIREQGRGPQRKTLEVLFTHTWRRRDGTWRWAAAHESEVRR
ncbi:MAG: nuclear transport factor 2 family protein [Myxococcaceae bacterium]